MLIKQYAAFVARTDQFTKKAGGDQLEANPRDIAIYGLASEIGSIVSALKKELLQEGGPLSSPLAKAELQEELGDAMWYAFALARIQDSGDDILVADIQNLEIEIAAKTVRGARIREVLPEADMRAFFQGAETFKRNPRRTLSDYQHLAFKTARTKPEVLLGVCAGVLSQLGAQLMRHLLPDLEKDLNKQLEDRPIETVLSETAWHICAIASLYNIEMNEVAEANVRKASARQGDGEPTALHDKGFPAGQSFPRKFEVEFRSVDDDTVHIYWNGKMRGNALKDQYSIKDGYRFHDVMHLANVAVLGWSPVLRDLFEIKRKDCEKTKQQEDGGRAAVVEELVIKYIHREASRRAKELHGDLPAYERPMFPEGEDVPFSLIKQARELTEGHEVYKNKYWEWERAIREGYRVFDLLRAHKGGFVIVDLMARELTFRPGEASD